MFCSRNMRARGNVERSRPSILESSAIISLSEPCSHCWLFTASLVKYIRKVNVLFVKMKQIVHAVEWDIMNCSLSGLCGPCGHVNEMCSKRFFVCRIEYRIIRLTHETGKHKRYKVLLNLKFFYYS